MNTTKEQRDLIRHWALLVQLRACPLEDMASVEAEMEEAGITQAQINHVLLKHLTEGS